jgi:hypothetical protein
MSRDARRDFGNEGSGAPNGKHAGFSEPRTAAKDYGHARAAGGEVDHATLTRRIIARFPKILAALAK